MKLLLYDKFWDSFIDLPRNIQKEVTKFQKKFRENSKSAAIHLEPISTFKDQSLRTARINDKYRAIIKAPDKGDAYYLLWVDNHDEAMAWAKNKMFQWNVNTQSIQVFTMPDNVDTVLPEPKKEEIKSGLAKFKDKDLLRIGVPEILLPSAKKITSMDDLEAFELFLPRDTFEHLFYLLDGATIEQVMSDIEAGKTSSTVFDDQQVSINNQRNFIELTDDALFNEAISGELAIWKFYLHPSQRVLVDRSFNGPMKVSGGAGTGKTVAALHRLKYISENFKIEEPILFTTHTKALTQNLEELVTSLKIDKGKVEVKNIDLVARSLGEKYGLIEKKQKIIGISSVMKSPEIWEKVLESELIAFDKDFIISEFENIILYHDVKSLNQYLRTSRIGRGKAISRMQRAELWKVFESYMNYKKQHNLVERAEVFNLVTNYLKEQNIHPYSYCIADELQDFSNVELRFIRALVAEKANDLFLVGDPLQKIWDKRINFSSVGINVRGRSKRLRINYRTTEEIKKLAVNIVKEYQFDDFDGEEESKKGYVSLFNGISPTYQIFKTANEQSDYILEQIHLLEENKVKLSEIAICTRKKSDIKDFVSVLHNEKIDYYQIDGKENYGSTKGVRLATFHTMKGLEFKHVFLVNVNNQTSPLKPYAFNSWDEMKKQNHLKKERSLLYVAISRAIHQVSVSGVGRQSEIINIT